MRNEECRGTDPRKPHKPALAARMGSSLCQSCETTSRWGECKTPQSASQSSQERQFVRIFVPMFERQFKEHSLMLQTLASISKCEYGDYARPKGLKRARDKQVPAAACTARPISLTASCFFARSRADHRRTANSLDPGHQQQLHVPQAVFPSG